VAVPKAGLIALALVLLTGCGGKSGPSLTKEEYASKADAICGKTTSKIQALGGPKNVSELADVADKTLPLLDQALDDLRKLRPPASEKALSDQWLRQWSNLRRDLADIRDEAKRGNLPGVTALVPRASDHNSRSQALATRLGMSVCNKG
jgi:hypothetical protein